MTKPQRRRPGAVSPLAAHVEPVRTPRSDGVESAEAAVAVSPIATAVEPSIEPPVEPQVAPPVEPQADVAGAPERAAKGKAKAQRDTRAISEPAAARPEAKVAVTLMVRAELKARAETAVLVTAGRPGGHRSWAALVNEAVARELDRLADEFNDGVPFQANEGAFRTGAPFRS